MYRAAAAVIEFRDVVKRFGETPAVDNVTFTVNAGETVALLGPSGCGKTTTLRLISGFEAPDSGSIEIAGESMAGKRPYERNVGLLFQHYALFPHMTVAENVAYGLKHRHWPRGEIPGRIAEMLRLVRLEGLDDRRPGSLSGGQQQRVALARVLATRPKLVLLDEPLSALDAKLREALRLELKQILAAAGSTAIVVTHDQEEAMSLADRIMVMNLGRIEQQGSPDEIYAKPSTPFVASFIGRTNWLHGRITGRLDQTIVQLTTTAGTALTVNAPEAIVGGRFSVCVRPERILILGQDAISGEPGDNTMPGQVADIVNMGAELHTIVDCADGRMIAVKTNDGGSPVRKGDRVFLRFRAESCNVFPQAGD